MLLPLLEQALTKAETNITYTQKQWIVIQRVREYLQEAMDKAKVVVVAPKD